MADFVIEISLALQPVVHAEPSKSPTTARRAASLVPCRRLFESLNINP
jgi:hypothetical protein